MGTSAAALAATMGAAAVVTSHSEFDAAFWPLFLAAFRAAHRILGDRHAAEDVAADAVARAHVHWRRIGGKHYREAWVVRVATNRALDVCRRNPPAVPAAAPAAFDDDAAMRLSLFGALHGLPRRQREAVVLRFLVGLSVADVADVLAIGPGSVRTHLKRGLRRLRDQLGEDVGIDGIDGIDIDPESELP